MPAETPIHHSAAKTANAARSFRIEVPPLGSRINYVRAGDWFRRAPSPRPHAVPVSAAEQSKRNTRTRLCDLIVAEKTSARGAITRIGEMLQRLTSGGKKYRIAMYVAA